MQYMMIIMWILATLITKMIDDKSGMCSSMTRYRINECFFSSLEKIFDKETIMRI